VVGAQVLQVAFVLLFAPLLKGYMDRLKARGMRRRGPPLLQPYYNLAKWFQKERIYSTQATGLSRLTPALYFVAPVVVTLLIPVLTTFPLPLAFMGDMLGGGMILGAGGLVLLWAGLDAGSPYTGIGVSRVRFISTLAEPITLVALFTAAAVGRATIPYVVNQAFAAEGFWQPGHLLLLAAWVLLILAEAGRLPVDNPDSTHEFSLIDPNRVFEAAGPDLALYEWGSWMKLTVLGIILVNVLATPAGLSPSLAFVPLAWAIVATALKLGALGTVIVVTEWSFAKLRLMRVAEYLTLVLALAAVAAVAVIP
jgi:formate hydrogenlyase subunit 4